MNPPSFIDQVAERLKTQDTGGFLGSVMTRLNSTQSTAPTDIGIPHEELKSQVTQLARTTPPTPISKIHSAIDAHPQITDKEQAKKMASDFYASNPQVQPTLTKKLGLENDPAMNTPFMIPFLEGKIGNEMRKKSADLFPFTDEAKKVIDSNTYIDKEWQKKPYDAVTSPERNFNRIPFGLELSTILKGFSSPFTDSMQNFLNKETGGKVRLGFQDTGAIAGGHELIHAIDLTKGILKDKINTFNSSWDSLVEKQSEKYPWLKQIDDHIMGKGNTDTNLYDPEKSGVPPEVMAQERLAYLGEGIGTTGGNFGIIPPELQDYYSKIFRFPARETNQYNTDKGGVSQPQKNNAGKL